VPVDWLGAGLLAVGAGALLLVLTTSPGDWRSLRVAAEATVAVVATTAFARAERAARDPILPFFALRDPIISGSIVCCALGGMLMFGAIAYVPLFVQGVIGTTAVASGVALAPMMLAAVVASFICGQVISRTGRYRWNIFIGPAALVLGSGMLWRLSPDATTSDVESAMVVLGCGIGSVFQVFTLSVQNAVGRARIGTVTALAQFGRHLGASVGIATMGLIASRHFPIDQLNSPTSRGGHLSAGGRVALAEALQPAFLAMTIAAICMWLVALIWVKEVPLRQAVDPVAATVETASSV
jgi:hypothetical protein